MTTTTAAAQVEIVGEIRRLAKEKNAIILAHNHYLSRNLLFLLCQQMPSLSRYPQKYPLFLSKVAKKVFSDPLRTHCQN